MRLAITPLPTTDPISKIKSRRGSFKLTKKKCYFRRSWAKSTNQTSTPISYSPHPRQYSQAPRGQIGMEDWTLNTTHEGTCSVSMDSSLIPQCECDQSSWHTWNPQSIRIIHCSSVSFIPHCWCVPFPFLVWGFPKVGVWMRNPNSNSPHLTNSRRHKENPERSHSR